MFCLLKLPNWESTDSPTWSWQHMIIVADCDADASLPSPSWFSFSFFYILAQDEKNGRKDFFQFFSFFTYFPNNVIGFYLICVLHIVVLRIMITIYTLLIDYAGTTVLRVIWITFLEKAQASCLKHLVWILDLPPLSFATLNKLFNSSDPRFPDAKWAQ